TDAGQGRAELGVQSRKFRLESPQTKPELSWSSGRSVEPRLDLRRPRDYGGIEPVNAQVLGFARPIRVRAHNTDCIHDAAGQHPPCASHGLMPVEAADDHEVGS